MSGELHELFMQAIMNGLHWIAEWMLIAANPYFYKFLNRLMQTSNDMEIAVALWYVLLNRVSIYQLSRDCGFSILILIWKLPVVRPQNANWNNLKLCVQALTSKSINVSCWARFSSIQFNKLSVASTSTPHINAFISNRWNNFRRIIP